MQTLCNASSKAFSPKTNHEIFFDLLFASNTFVVPALLCSAFKIHSAFVFMK